MTAEPRKEQCTNCWEWVAEWVDPEWWDGRICLPCETKLQPIEEPHR